MLLIILAIIYIACIIWFVQSLKKSDEEKFPAGDELEHLNDNTQWMD